MECVQVQLWNYFLIFFLLLNNSRLKRICSGRKKKIEKDNFLIETTYSTANFGKTNQLQSRMIAKNSLKLQQLRNRSNKNNSCKK